MIGIATSWLLESFCVDVLAVSQLAEPGGVSERLHPKQ
ncbi:hypothetical protein SynA1560_01372 [Synechococcus sp. A15-60]|nr:hypothetical protein SynA1560_01372 [Synechococcus sp. A15-60]